MQKLTYYVASTLDGFIAREDGSFSDFVWDDELVADYFATIETFSTVLMGRKTYELGLAEGKTSPYPSLQQLVFSRSMEKSPDPAVELVRSDAARRMSALKQEEGNGIWLCGGADLATLCLEAGLLDALVLKLNPIIFGRGIPLFRQRVDLGGLELTERKVYASSGIVQLHYRFP